MRYTTLLFLALSLSACAVLPHPKPNKPVPTTIAIKEHLVNLDTSNTNSQKHVQTALELADQLDDLLTKIDTETAVTKK